MAEVQHSTESGELAQHFTEFVMMQAQNAALFLGQLPSPHSGQVEVNIDLAAMFIDHLVMIRAKTRGNLSADEQALIDNAIAGLQTAYTEVAQASTPPQPLPVPSSGSPDDCKGEIVGTAPNANPADDSRKRFTKSYGA